MSGRTVTGRHAKRRIYSDVGWSAKKLADERPSFRGLGNLPHQGLAYGTGSAVCLTTSGWFGQIIQRSEDGGKTWEPPGGSQTHSIRGTPKSESQQIRV